MTDPIAIHNERVKLVANSVNALAIGSVGFAVLRPLTTNLDSFGLYMIPWFAVGIGLHLIALRTLGLLKEK